MGTLGDAVVRTEPFAVSQTVQAGLLFKIASNRLTVIDAKANTPYAVALETFQDSAGTARTTVAGNRLPVALIGSGEIVQIKSVTAQTYAKGGAVYLDDAVDGQCTATNDTSTKIGHYVGPGVVTASGGELVKVMLDVANIG